MSRRWVRQDLEQRAGELDRAQADDLAASVHQPAQVCTAFEASFLQSQAGS